MAEKTTYMDDGTVIKASAITSNGKILVEQETGNLVSPNLDAYGDPITKTEAYTVKLMPGAENNPIASNYAANATIDALPSLSSLNYPQKQEALTTIANNAYANYSNYQNAQKIEDSSVIDSGVVRYTPTYDYTKDLEANTLDPSSYQTLGPLSGQIAKLDSRSSIANAPGGITVNERDRKLDGIVVNPYSRVANPTGEMSPYDIIGGSDLTVFLVMEYVPPDQLAIDPALQNKDMMMVEMDSVLSISYSTIRERFPVRQMGIPNPVATTAGIRTIAGHIAFAVFTEDVLGRLRSRVKNELESVSDQFKKWKDTKGANLQDYDIKRALWEKQQQAYNEFCNDSARNSVMLLDQLPPFHLLIMGVNEAGTFVQFMIKNVSIVDENQYQGTQQPNIINKVSYVACDLVPLQKIGDASTRMAVHSASSIDESYSKGKYNGRINYNYEVTGSGLMDAVLDDLAKG